MVPPERSLEIQAIYRSFREEVMMLSFLIESWSMDLNDEPENFNQWLFDGSSETNLNGRIDEYTFLVLEMNFRSSSVNRLQITAETRMQAAISLLVILEVYNFTNTF